MLDMLGSVILIVINKGYTLVEIQDEPVPLGAFPEVGSQYSGIVAGVMMLMVLAWLAAVYLLNCFKNRSRIRQLRSEEEIYYGWNLKRLKETVVEMELQEAEPFLD